MKKILLLFTTLALSIASCMNVKAPVPLAGCPDKIYYSTDVKPIIDSKCVTCHTAGGAGVGDFTQFSEVQSRAALIKKRACDPATLDMPQAGSPPLTQDEIDKLRCWIDQGALDN
jgi:uncharacterized membrane protein